MPHFIDPDSQTWRAVKAWAETSRASLRAQLESTGTDHTTTESLRYRIAQLNELLGLADDKPVISSGSRSYTE